MRADEGIRASGWVVRGPQDTDRQSWHDLYRGYAEFYRVQQSEADRERVWSWITNPDHEVNALLAQKPDGSLAGLAHYRPFARPLSASMGCFLDDLFVDPTHRGGGAVDALLAELRHLADVNSWSVVRWISADDNYRGRAKYDQYATLTTWITYDM